MDTRSKTIDETGPMALSHEQAVYRKLFDIAVDTPVNDMEARAHLSALSDDVLHEFGFTSKQIRAIRDSAETRTRAGSTYLDRWAAYVDRKGRTLQKVHYI